MRKRLFLALLIALAERGVLGHSRRVACYAARLGKRLGLNKLWLDRLAVAALLHDAGKVAVDAKVLHKAARLDKVEVREMRRHTVYGEQILSGLFPVEVVKAAVAHHECLDGSGYPRGLRGREIPFLAQVIAVADVFDALTADDRPYRKPMGLVEVKEAMVAEAGKLNPEIIDLFFHQRLHMSGRRWKIR